MDGAIIASDESDSYKIIIKSASGVAITVKPDDLHHRDIWIAALKLQVMNLAKSIKKISWSLLAEERAMMISGTDDQIIIPSIAIKHRSWLTECEIQEKIAIRDAIRNTGIDIL